MSSNSFIDELVNSYGGEELFHLVRGTLNTTGEKYQVCKLIKEGDVRILHWYVTNNKVVLKDFNFDESNFYFNTLYNDKDYAFDLLVFAIDCKAPLDIIKYIVDRTPYKNLNYGIKLNMYKFRVPLFHALVKNEFKVADYLISKGANLDYVYKCPVGKVDDPWSTGRLRYCAITDEEDDLNWYLSIRANVLNYLREFKSVNEENLKYLEDHGYSFSPSRKEEMIREANRDEQKEFTERLMKSILKK